MTNRCGPCMAPQSMLSRPRQDQHFSTFPAMPISSMQNPGEPRSQARFLTTLLLLWLAGTALRLTILAVPPVIPLIHDGLKLNATQIGILTGLPSMLFAIAAVRTHRRPISREP